MTSFKVGSIYITRLVTDADAKLVFTVKARTAKTITLRVNNTDKRLKIHCYRDCEIVYPWGRYSMCPLLFADREVADAPVLNSVEDRR